MRWFADFGRSPKKVLALKQATDRLRLPIFVCLPQAVRALLQVAPRRNNGNPSFKLIEAIS